MSTKNLSLVLVVLLFSTVLDAQGQVYESGFRDGILYWLLAGLLALVTRAVFAQHNNTPMEPPPSEMQGPSATVVPGTRFQDPRLAFSESEAAPSAQHQRAQSGFNGPQMRGLTHSPGGAMPEGGAMTATGLAPTGGIASGVAAGNPMMMPQPAYFQFSDPGASTVEAPTAGKLSLEGLGKGVADNTKPTLNGIIIPAAAPAAAAQPAAASSSSSSSSSSGPGGSPSAMAGGPGPGPGPGGPGGKAQGGQAAPQQQQAQQQQKQQQKEEQQPNNKNGLAAADQQAAFLAGLGAAQQLFVGGPAPDGQPGVIGLAPGQVQPGQPGSTSPTTGGTANPSPAKPPSGSGYSR